MEQVFTRFRERSKQSNEGIWRYQSRYLNYSMGGWNHVTTHEQSWDSTSNGNSRPDHDWLLIKKQIDPIYISGSISAYHVDDFFMPSYTFGKFNDTTALPNFGTENWSSLFTSAVANMNPNTPTLDLPMMLVELRDFPRMLRNLGRWLKFRHDVPKENMHKAFTEFSGLMVSEDPRNLIPETFLSYQFGWAPLISDIKTFLDVQKDWEDRLNYLRDLKAGVRQRRTLGSDKSSYSSYYPIWLFNKYLLDVHYSVEESTEIWFTSTPKLVTDVPIPISNDASQRPEGTKFASLMYGVGRADYSTLWNLLPWSWFIDYFSNIGDVLEANRGGIEWTYDNVNIMAHRTRNYTYDSANWPNGIDLISTPSATHEQKARKVVPLSNPGFAWEPWLTLRQSANLGSLSLMFLLGKKK